jgi:hypothetical protein
MGLLLAAVEQPLWSSRCGAAAVEQPHNALLLD